MASKSCDTLHLPATLRPGSFPLGSQKSRAAVRAMLNAGEAEGDVMRVVISLLGQGADDAPLPPATRYRCDDGTLVEIVYECKGKTAIVIEE